MTTHRARPSRADRPLPVQTERAERAAEHDRQDRPALTDAQVDRVVAVLRPHRDLLAQQPETA